MIKKSYEMKTKSITALVAALSVLLPASLSAQDAPVQAQNGKAIVVFFSHAGDNYSVGKIKIGNTKRVADMISEITGAPQWEIVPEKDYHVPYDKLTEIAQAEADNGELPPYKGTLDVSEYDTIFIGGPIWWGTYPQVMFTFFKDHDLSGKTIIPFTTHEGSALGSTIQDLKNTYPNSTVTKGLAVYGHDAQNARPRVERWLKSLGY